jgi:hypothetical protein
MGTKRSDQIKLSKPWAKAVIKKLNVGYKKGGIDYVEHTQVTQRLIAIIPDLQMKAGSFIYDNYEDDEGRTKKILTGIEYTIEGTIDGHYRSVTEVGMCDKAFEYAPKPDGSKPKVSNNGERAKECISDAVKRCAMRLGVGIELYDSTAWLSDYLEGYQAKKEELNKQLNQIKKKHDPKQQDPKQEDLKEQVDLDKLIEGKDIDKAVINN